MPSEAERLLAVPGANPETAAQESQPAPAQPPVEQLRRLGRALVETATEAETAPTDEPRLLLVDQRIISQINRFPDQSFSKQVVVEALATDSYQPLKESYIKKRMTALAKQGQIKRVGQREYASPDHPAPRWQPLEQLIIDRVSQLVVSQPNREWEAATVLAALNSSPNNSDPPLKLLQVRASLAYLDGRGDQVRAVGWGRYTSVSHDSPDRQPRPRSTGQHLIDLLGQHPTQAFDQPTASESLAADGHRPVKGSTVINSLKRSSQQGLIKRVIDQNHYASLDSPLPEYQPPVLLADRLKRLLQDNDQDFTNKAASQALAAHGDPPPNPKYIQFWFRKLELKGLAIQTKPGHYARPDYAPAANCPPMIVQIIAKFEADTNRAWSIQDLAEVIQHPDPDRTVEIASLNAQLARLARQRRIKRIGRGCYASRKHPAPDYIPPSPNTTISLEVCSDPPLSHDQTDRKSRKPVQAKPSRKAGPRQSSHPSHIAAPKPTKPATKTKPQPAPRRRSAKTNRADRADSYPITPPPPKMPTRISLGQRIGRIANSLSGPATPDDIVDWVETDGHGSVDRQLAGELAESVLKRKGKLAS